MKHLILFVIIGCLIFMIVGYLIIHNIIDSPVKDTIYITDTIYKYIDINYVGPEV